MSTLAQVAQEFLTSRRIAVAGVSRDAQQAANLIFRKLKATGHSVVPVNPRTDRAEGEACYPDLRAIPEPVDGLVIATPSGAALDLVRQCRDLGIRRVWMHRAVGPGSVSDEAVRFCRENGITVIPGACPMMFCAPDVAHRCMRTVLTWMHRIPAEVT